jgi:hypothetical protein
VKIEVFWIVTVLQSKQLASLSPASAGFLFGIFFDAEDGGDMFL